MDHYCVDHNQHSRHDFRGVSAFRNTCIGQRRWYQEGHGWDRFHVAYASHANGYRRRLVPLLSGKLALSTCIYQRQDISNDEDLTSGLYHRKCYELTVRPKCFIRVDELGSWHVTTPRPIPMERSAACSTVCQARSRVRLFQICRLVR